MDACVRRELGNHFSQDGNVPQIANVNVHRKKRSGGLGGIERERRVTGVDQFTHDMSADESARACHEDAHRYFLIWVL